MKVFGILVSLLIAVCSWAQGPGRPPGGDPLMENFFPPELLMQNQSAIALSDQQKSSVKAEMSKAQEKFTNLQWELQAEQEQLAQLARQEHVDESPLLGALDKVLATETEIKKTHLALLARVKNILTPEQQSKLRELRPKMRPPMRGPGGPGNPGGEPSGGPPPQG